MTRLSWTAFVSVAVLLWTARGAGQTGWKNADADYQLVLPRDHASHPEYKIEWWYYTGNLEDTAGRRFGYQVTFFRVGVDPQPENPSRWSVRDLYMTHVAVSDIDAGRFLYAERLNRAGIGWAGAATDRYDVWNQSWRARSTGNAAHELSASDARFALDLRLDEGKPFTAHGQRGFSQKGSRPGNASHYYSLTRMPTRGRLTVDGIVHDVQGLSWMDHEFGSSFLEPEQTGWNWFSLQLDDGSEVMAFELRRRDGSRDAHSSGTFVPPNGPPRTFGAADFVASPGRAWTSPASGASYPVEWGLDVPDLGIRLRTSAALRDQELRTSGSTGVTYWEGSVNVEGQRAGRPVRGRGYVEMTGYVGTSMGDLLR